MWPFKRKPGLRCGGCKGSGTCPKCKGQGHVMGEMIGAGVPAGGVTTIVCNRCNGNGVCVGCGGSGWVGTDQKKDA